MQKVENKSNEGIVYDFFNEHTALLWVGGYAAKRNAFYKGYITLMFAFHCYIQGMAFYGMYKGAPRSDLVLGALHVQLISTFAIWGLTTRILTDRSLHKTRDILLSGIYNYEDEEPDSSIVRMKEGIKGEIKRKSNLFIFIFFSGAMSNLVYYPISQLLMVSEDETHSGKYDLANPYIAHFYYYPFDTKTPGGFIGVYLTNICLMLFIYGVACCMNEVYISVTVQMKIHLQVLNLSIRNIHRRAYGKLVRSSGQRLDRFSREDLSKNKEFQKHLISCLRSNIEHHHALLRLYKESQPFNGSCLLDTITLASIIYASVVYSMYQKPPIHILINYVLTLLAEQTYAFYMCVFGEEIIQESSNLFESLYAIPWMEYNKDFNQILRIMMSNTQRPIKVKALLLSFSTSLETYADLFSTMYKMMNVWRQSEKKK